jgi:hypothetical protein
MGVPCRWKPDCDIRVGEKAPTHLGVRLDNL